MHTTPDLNLSPYGWRIELNKIVSKNLIIGSIIASILNPVFGLVDYLTMNEQWQEFMIIRIAVSIIIVGSILNRSLINKRPDITGFFILLMLITQDAYFFSQATTANIQQVSLAYMADFVGASMVLLWSPVLAIIFFLCFVNINLAFFLFQSQMNPGDFLVDGGLMVLAGAIFSMAMIVFRHHSVKNMIISKLELIRSNHWMAVQNEIIEEKSVALQKSNSRLKEFAYIVSHDLKAPLRGIRNIASWIKEDLGNSVNDDGEAHLQLMDKQILKMEQLINAVLEYSKTAITKSNVEWLNMDEIIKDVIDMVEIDNRTKFKIENLVPEMKGTRIVISQVLQNLISNSIKHNDKTLREVEIKISDKNEFYEFMISDNGPGIHEKDHSRIFDLFQTLRNEQNYENSGIGLPVARKMVEEEGGRMWLESYPGNGSKFYFSIPKSV